MEVGDAGVESDQRDLEKRLEAVLFLETKAPVPSPVLARQLGCSSDELQSVIHSLNRRLADADSVLHVRSLDDGWQLALRPEYSDPVLDSYRDYIAYGGSAILIIVGLVGLLSKAKPKDINDAPVTITGGHYFRIWASGFIINTVNPGVIISWLTAVSATANSSGPYRFILFATCLILILAIDFLKVFLAGRIRLLLTPQRVVYVQKASSLILGGLGVLLLAKTFFGKK